MKEHKGRITDWRIYPSSDGQGFRIVGYFLDHPKLFSDLACTSQVIKYDKETGEIETLNSRYRLVDDDPLT